MKKRLRKKMLQQLQWTPFGPVLRFWNGRRHQAYLRVVGMPEGFMAYIRKRLGNGVYEHKFTLVHPPEAYMLPGDEKKEG